MYEQKPSFGAIRNKEKYMVKIEGKRKVHIIEMAGEPQYNGREGYVTYIDGMGQIHGTWGGLALQPNRDRFEITIESVEDK